MFTSRFIDIPLLGSQFGQAYLVANILFPGKTGYFVDVGARCGKVISNTDHLEQIGWDGLCIEPHPDLYPECVANRSCPVINSAASDRTGTLEFVKIEEHPVCHSGILETFWAKHRLDEIKHSIISVVTERLAKILSDNSAPRFIEYLDIDVEGHEIEVLNGVDFNQTQFGTIGVEVKPESQKFHDISDILAPHGYRPFCFLGSDTFYLNREVFDKNVPGEIEYAWHIGAN